jgi:4-hydroxy-2-oxoheptanedioate aldolase
MKTNTAKQKLERGEAALGTWLSMGNGPATRLLARSGFHWLTVDLEHTGISWETAAWLFGAIADAGCVPLVRVPANRHDHIKRALDCGAFGVVVPMVNSRQEALDAVAACRYPPVGNRSVGGNLHALNFNAAASDYYAGANQQILVVLQCEHIDAVNRADELFSVPGIDAIFVGPNDLAASMRGPDNSPPSAQASAEAHATILAACQRHKVAPGFHAMNAAEARHRVEQGWRFVAVASDLRFMTDGTAQALSTIGLSGGQELARY